MGFWGMFALEPTDALETAFGGFTLETNDSHSSKQPSWRAGGGRGMLTLKTTDNSCRTQFVKGLGVSDLEPNDNSPKKHPREGSIYPGAYQ